MMLGEYWDLTALAADCAADGVYEFQLVAPPLSVVGAVGSPVNPDRDQVGPVDSMTDCAPHRSPPSIGRGRR